jgi:regulator of protease activity HflC (stomatin/prohibitin superfamily)
METSDERIMREKINKGVSNVLKYVPYLVVGLFVFVFVADSFGFINAGRLGLLTRFGKVERSLQAGFFFKLPFVEGVVPMDIQTQVETVSSVESASQDLQTVRADVAVNFHLLPESAPVVFTTIGLDYSERVIAPAIQESVKAVTAKYTAEQLITHREEVRDGIIALLTSKLNQFGIRLDALNITNFDFSKTFNDAIEAKVTAEQSALTAKNLLEQKKYEGEQIVVTANAQAQAIAIQAKAVTSQGGADYVKLKWIEKWDGKMPSTSLGSSGVIIDLAK